MVEDKEKNLSAEQEESQEQKEQKELVKEVQDRLTQYDETLQGYSESFYEEAKMGGIAVITGNEIFSLSGAVKIHGEILLLPPQARPVMDEDEYGRRKTEAETKILEKAKVLYQVIADTVELYATENLDKNHFEKYLFEIGDMHSAFEEILIKLGMLDGYQELMKTHGQGATNSLDFKIYLRFLYEKASGNSDAKLPKFTVDVVDQVDPAEFVDDLREKINEVQPAQDNQPRTRTYIGLGQRPAIGPTWNPTYSADQGQTSGDPVVTMSAVKTDIGVGVPVAAVHGFGGVGIPPRPPVKIPENGSLPKDAETLLSGTGEAESPQTFLAPQGENGGAVAVYPTVEGQPVEDTGAIGDAPPSGTFTLSYGEPLPVQGRVHRIQPAASGETDMRNSQPEILMSLEEDDTTEVHRFDDLADEETDALCSMRTPTIKPPAPKLEAVGQTSTSSVPSSLMPKGIGFDGKKTVVSAVSIPSESIPAEEEIHEVSVEPSQPPVVEVQRGTIISEPEIVEPDLPDYIPPSSYRPGALAPARRISSKPPVSPAVLEPVKDEAVAPFTQKWSEQQQAQNNAQNNGGTSNVVNLPPVSEPPIKFEEETPSSRYLKTALVPQVPVAVSAPVPAAVSVPNNVPGQLQENPAPFTREWATQQAALNAGREREKALTPAEEPKKSAGRSRGTPSSSREEITAVGRRRPESPAPEAVRTGSRNRLLNWGLAAGAVLGLTGLVGGLAYNSCGPQKNNSTDRQASAAASASASSPETAASGTARAAAKTTAEKTGQAETQTKSVKGIIRIDSKSSAFQGYLCHFKGASMLASTMKKLAMSTQVNFSQDLQERQNAEKHGKTVLTGSEDEKTQRLALMENYLSLAQKEGSGNGFIKNYFRHQLAGFEDFKATGVWSREAQVYGVDKLYNSLILERLETAPEVIGYAPVADASANPAWRNVQEYAPAFAKVSQEAARRLHLPENAVPYDDPRLIKEAVCIQIRKIGQDVPTIKSLNIGRPSDVQAGTDYMYRAWCADECTGFINPLERAILMTEPVKADKPQASPEPVPSESIPDLPEVQSVPQPQPQHSWFKWPWKKQQPVPVQQVLPQPVENQYACAAPEKKPGLLSRAVSKVKEFFGFGGKGAEKPADSQYASTTDANWSPFIMDDTIVTPKQTWKETLKDYFWG